MIFPYRRYPISPTPAFPGGVLYRPEVLIHVFGPADDVFLRGLVDTGADSTIFPRSLAEVLGVDLDYSQTFIAAGFTGDEVAVAYAEIELEVKQGKEGRRWRTIVGFVDYPEPESEQTLLGRVGFLDQFRSTFDPVHNELTLLGI
jgi:hypothetical protein